MKRRTHPPRGSWTAALTALMIALPAAARGGELQDLLRPGSRVSTALAGDPFRAKDGWSGWADRAFDAAPGVELGAATSRMLERDHTPFDLNTSRATWTVSHPVAAGRVPIAAAARLTLPAYEASWAGGLDGFRLSGKASGVDLAMRASALVPGATFEAIAPLGGPDGVGRSPLGVGLEWSAMHRLALRGAVTWARVSDPFALAIAGERIGASLNLESRHYRGDLRLQLTPAIAIHGEIDEHALHPLRGRSRVDYTLEPFGSIRSAGATAEWGRLGGPRALVRRSARRASVEADLSWSGERFGNLNYAVAEIDSWLGAVESSIGRGGRVMLDVESAHAQASARAEVESWPFTSAFEDLLGLRRIGRGAAAADWEVWHTAIERRVGQAGILRGGVAWYDARPVATVESWRPVLLVFGRTDQTHAALGTRRLQLAEAAFGAEMRFGAIEMELAIRQIVFARKFESREPPPAASDGSGGEVGTSANEGRGRRAWSPGRVELTLARRF